MLHCLADFSFYRIQKSVNLQNHFQKHVPNNFHCNIIQCQATQLYEYILMYVFRSSPFFVCGVYQYNAIQCLLATDKTFFTCIHYNVRSW